MTRIGISISIFLVFGCSAARAQEESPAPRVIAINPAAHEKPVDFQTEILPFFKDNCLACHNQTRSKAGLILETPLTILQGGDSGPAVVPGKPADSLLLKAASHQLEDIVMPPKNNKVAANNLSPDQLGLLQLWIEQGAKGEVHQSGPVHWRPVPSTFQPIYAVAITPDDRFVACSRGNGIQIYHLPSAAWVTSLADPGLMSTGTYVQPTAHADIVQALDFNQDGTTLASGAYREIKLWRQEAPSRQFHFAANRPLKALSASPNGQWIALAGADPGIILYNAAQGTELHLLSGHTEPLTALSFAPDSGKLVSVARDHTLRLWSLSEELASTNLPSLALSAVWINSNLVAVGAEDHVIGLWSIPSAPDQPLALLRELKGHEGAVTSLAAYQDQLLSGSADGHLRWWNIQTGESIKVLENGSPVLAVAIRPDGERFASVGDNRMVRFWSRSDLKMIAEWKGDWRTRLARQKQERVLNLASAEIDFGKQTLKTANEELGKSEERRKKAVELQEKSQKEFSATEKELAESREKKAGRQETLASLQQQLEESRKHAEETAQAALLAKKEVEQAQSQTPSNEAVIRERQSAADSKEMAAEEAKQKAAHLSEEFKAKESKANEEIKSVDKEISKLEKELDKNKLARDTAVTELELASKALESDTTSVEQSKRTLAEAETEKEKAAGALETSRERESAAEQPLRCLSFSPDNRLLAVGGDQAGVQTYSADTGDFFDGLEGKAEGLVAMAFLGADRIVTAGAKGDAEVLRLRQPWSLAQALGTGDASSPILDRVNALAFSPDNQWLASGGGEPSRSGEILLWQMPTGQLAHAWREIHNDSVLALEFSPNGLYLASAAADRFLRVTELATGKVFKAFEGHTHHLLGLSWKADGRTLASAGADNIVKIWNFDTGERKKNIEGFGKEVTSVHFVSTTDQAIATSGDNSVRLINESGKTIRQFKGPSDFVYASAVTADGETLVAGGQDGILRVWNLADGKLRAELPPLN